MTTETKLDVYQRVTDRIVAELEAGARPWCAKRWSAGEPGQVLQLPSRHNGEAYKGVNTLLLWLTGQSMGYRSNVWMTFKQALEYGGAVRKGERGTLVVYADRFKKTEQNAAGEDIERSIPFMKGYTVFNVDQIDGLPERFQPADMPAPVASPVARHAAAEHLITATGAEIRHGGDRAFYAPSRDVIQVPAITQFEGPEHYYSTLLHELTHWTKHESRLARDFPMKRWGDEGYAAEELVAELGAAFLCAALGVENVPLADHVGYLANWLQVLKNDKRAIFTAASYAQRAADFLLAKMEGAPAPGHDPAPIDPVPPPAPPRPPKPRLVITAAMQAGAQALPAMLTPVQKPAPIAAPIAAPAASIGQAAPKAARPRKAAALDVSAIRTAAEEWQAGEAARRPRKSAYRKGEAKAVRVTFADGVTVRASTYLDGDAGIIEAVRFARTIRQSPRIDRMHKGKRGVWFEENRAGQWVRDGKGCWRLLQIRECPAVVSAEFVQIVRQAA